MIRFNRYTHPEELAASFGPCPRKHCNGAMVTCCVGDPATHQFRLSCDNERCLADAVELVRTGQGI